MFPSSPVSVGTLPSNRTLEAGSVQTRIDGSSKLALEQRPSAEDPLTALPAELKAEMRYREGRI